MKDRKPSLRASCLFLILSAGSLLVLLPGCEKNTGKGEILFFYMESCPSCDEYRKAEELSAILQKMDRSRDWDTASYNIAIPENMPKLKDALRDRTLPDISRSLPLLIIDKGYINGYGEIEQTLLEFSTEK